MRSKAFIQEKSTRRRIITTLVFIIAGLSSFYNYQSFLVNKRFKNQLVDFKVNEVHQSLLLTFNKNAEANLLKADKIYNSPLISDAIAQKDSSFLHRYFESNLNLSDGVSYITIKALNNTLHFGNTSCLDLKLDFSQPIDSKHWDKTASQKIKISKNGIFRSIDAPLLDDNRIIIEFSINLQDALRDFEKREGAIAFVFLDKELLKQVKEKSITFLNYSPELQIVGPSKLLDITRIVEIKGFDDPIEGKNHIIKQNGKFICLSRAANFLQGDKPAGYIITAIEVTNLEAPFRSLVIRSIILTLVIILFAFILINVFFDQLLERFFKIDESFEREVAERTKKILDTNIELSQIFNSTANGMRIINKNYEIIRVNRAFCQISGADGKKVEGQKCYDVFPGVFCHTSNCPLDKIRDGENSIESEEVRFKQGGKKIRCQHIAVPFLGNNGEFLGIIEDFKDISEKYEVEDTLKRTEKQFSTFLDSLPVSVFIKDHDGVLLYQNTHLKNIFGLDNLLGKNLSKELKADLGERIALEDEKVLQMGRIELEETLTDKEGHDRTFVTHKFRFPGADNKWKIGGISIDITKKKITEHFLYVLSKAIKNSPVSIVITDPKGYIEFINPSFSQLTGFSITEAIHRNLVEMKIEYNSGKNFIKAFETINKGEIWKGEIHIQNTNGDHFWASTSFAPILNRKGEVSHCVASMEDITIRKEYEKELLISKNKAEESDKLKTSFLSNLSHEIRTPLNAIIGFSALLTDSDLTQSEKRNLSDVLYKNSNDLLKLIENLIEISEIEAGQLIIKKSECNVNKLIEELKATFSADDKKGKSVKLNVRREIKADDFTILTDPLRLKQVLSNLISNAAKFTDNGFIEFGYAFKDERTLMFYVIDTGIGIEPEKQKYIFNPFRQADDSNTRRFGGMGLGLAISKHIVEKLGGKIWLTSIPGSGSTFYFTIPYIPIRFKFDPEPKERAANIYDWKNKTILVADDIDSNYVFLKTVIKQTNAEVIWAKTGIEAVEMVKKNPSIDLVLMDIVMPDMDGFEATKLIKKHNSNIPVICQTAYPTNENFHAANNCGFDSFMAKPIKVDGMLMAIDKFFPKN